MSRVIPSGEGGAVSDSRARLVKCFSVVFPQLEEGEIPQATLTSVAAWDSLATVTLITVVEEEFGVNIGLENLEQVTSFSGILDYLSRQNS